jgi:predicted nucleotidyltransferase
MSEINLTHKLRVTVDGFIKGLKSIYGEELISVVLYGSAASGEFTRAHSNLNLLIILKNTDLENLKKASGLIKKGKFRFIQPLFFTESYILDSNDVFPIEFLDMKENYTVLFGKDILKDVSIDIKNLRFQCEQELKVKLINLKQSYLKKKDDITLSNLLFKSFTSTLHILRNVLRLQGKKPPYLKQNILKEIAVEFGIEKDIWEKILAVKNKQVRLKGKEIEQLFIKFVREVEKISDVVDKL